MDSESEQQVPETWEAQAARQALLSEIVLLIAKTPEIGQLLRGAVNKLKWILSPRFYYSDKKFCCVYISPPQAHEPRTQLTRQLPHLLLFPSNRRAASPS